MEKNRLSLVSTHVGISDSGGDQRDLTYSLRCVMDVSGVAGPKKTLRWKSRSNLVVVCDVSPVVNGGVQMNLKPSPRTDLAKGGTILLTVRSWKARLEALK